MAQEAAVRAVLGVWEPPALLWESNANSTAGRQDPCKDITEGSLLPSPPCPVPRRLFDMNGAQSSLGGASSWFLRVGGVGVTIIYLPTTPAAPASNRSLTRDYALFHQLLPGPPSWTPTCTLPNVEVPKMSCLSKPQGTAQALVFSCPHPSKQFIDESLLNCLGGCTAYFFPGC